MLDCDWSSDVCSSDLADAVAEVRALAHWVARRPGGRGAVRQACEVILKAQGSWEQVTARYYQ
jgi:3-deoxy-D-manno-octulosonate 8-phosphate phosphatase (KDO 8-P phosphatase)